MLFNSFEFAFYLVAVFLLYWFVFNRTVILRNLFIIAVSYVFYGWWNFDLLYLIAFTSLCSYLSGIGISYFFDTDRKRLAKAVCIANIVVNLGILCSFKYYNFFITSFADHFISGDTSHLLLDLILPVGISFYTFQALSYSIDAYRIKNQSITPPHQQTQAISNYLPTHDITAFFAYLAFFPQLVAGPIERATNLLPQFCKLHKFDYHEAVEGMRMILWGLFKKIVVADNCATVVNAIFAHYNTAPTPQLWLGAIFFAFQIYGDFSGYSDIAIGTSKLFGINLLANFRLPYFSRDIGEFWRRWHISLNTWFRDYIYIPLGGSKVSKHKVIRNTFVIFLLSGLWHGANWTFVIWGAYHATLFLPLLLTKRNRKHLGIVAEGNRLPSIKEIGAMAWTFMLVVGGWIIFRSDTIGEALGYVKGMFWSHPEAISVYVGSIGAIICTMLMILLMISIEWHQRHRVDGVLLSGINNRYLRWTLYYGIVIAIFYSRSVESFIYFQF